MNNVTLNPNKSLTVSFDHPRPIQPTDRELIAKHICAVMLYGGGRVPRGLPYSDYPEKEFWVLDEHNDWFLTFDDETDGRCITIRHRNPQERHLHILGGLGFKLVDMKLLLLPSSFADNEPEARGNRAAVMSGFTLVELAIATVVLFIIAAICMKLGAFAASLVTW